MRETMTATPIEQAIACFREMKVRRYRLERAIGDMREVLCRLDEDLSDTEADLAVQLRDEGPRVVEGREYSHATRDGCDVVEVRPAGGGR